MTTIKATLKIPIQKFENPIFLFRRTHKVAVRNSRILASFKCDLGAAIAPHKEIPVDYRLELRDITALARLFLHHEGKIRLSI